MIFTLPNLFYLGVKVLTFVAMDSEHGVALSVNRKPSYTVAIGPNIVLDLQVSPTKGAVLVNNYLQEGHERARVLTITSIRNGIKKLALMGKLSRLRNQRTPAYNFFTNGVIGGNNVLDGKFLGGTGYMDSIYNNFIKRSFGKFISEL